MLTTNKIKPKERNGISKSTILVTEGGQTYAKVVTDPSKPKEQQRKKTIIRSSAKEIADPAKFIGVNRRETRKVRGDMLTTANYKDRLEALKPKPEKKKRGRGKKK